MAMDPEGYLRHDPNTVLKSYDGLYSVETYMRGLTHSEAVFNLSDIRDNLMTVLRGDCDDLTYIKSLNYCYDNSDLFREYVNYICFYYNNNINVIQHIVLPLVTRIDVYMILLQGECGGTYTHSHNGYIFMQDPLKDGDNPYVKVW